MPNNSDDPKSASPAKHTPARTHLPPLLGILIGLGALAILLIIAGITGSLIYTWFLRVPQATLSPLSPLQIPGDTTQVPPTDLIPSEDIPATPAEGMPFITATPFQQNGAAPQLTPVTSYDLIVIVDSLNVRTGPGTLYPVVITYPKGTRLLAIGRNEDASWFVISISSTQQGWVSAPLVRYDFDRYLLPVFPTPPLEYTPPTPYGSAILVPPELAGSQPFTVIPPARRLFSLAVAGMLTSILIFLERSRLARLARGSLRQVLVSGAHILPH